MKLRDYFQQYHLEGADCKVLMGEMAACISNWLNQKEEIRKQLGAGKANFMANSYYLHIRGEHLFISYPWLEREDKVDIEEVDGFDPDKYKDEVKAEVLKELQEEVFEIYQQMEKIRKK